LSHRNGLIRGESEAQAPTPVAWTSDLPQVGDVCDDESEARGLETPREAAAETTSPTSAWRIERVQLRSISVITRNPRRRLERVDELAASIESHGLLQPVVVRRDGNSVELIAGHRRLEAVRSLGWTDIPALVRTDSDDDAYVLTLVENLQREDLNPKEEATALEILVRERGWTTREVANAIKRSQAYVSKRLRVFDDPVLAPAVLSNRLLVSTAEELLSVSERQRYALLYEVMEKGWDRGQLRAAIRGGFGAHRRSSTRPAGLTRRARDLRLALRDVAPEHLTEADRRELRMLFMDLALLAKAPRGKRKQIFPPLPA
jgi:ParB family transcriptional regulator, chromosome partitioning protein